MLSFAYIAIQWKRAFIFPIPSEERGHAYQCGIFRSGIGLFQSGKPAAEDWPVLICITEANVTKELRFNDAGKHESFNEQIGG